MSLSAGLARDAAVKSCEDCGKKTGWFRTDGRLLCGDCDRAARSPKKAEFVQSKSLFLLETTDNDIEQDIVEGIANLTKSETRTRPVQAGAPPTAESTYEMLRAGFKTIIEQNEVIIRQNELLRRQAKVSSDSQGR
jgi:uncharacterized Zn finger protein (UPF0148 family)